MFTKIENGKLTWYHVWKKKELPLTDIVWAYLQQEDVNARMCCANTNFPIGRVIVVRKNGEKEVFQYDGMDKPKQLLEELKKAIPGLAVGYTKENREKLAHFCLLERAE